MQYQIRFASYNRDKVESRSSGTHFVNVEDFASAVSHATTMVRGMSEVNPHTDYRILSVTEYGSRGIDCEGGGLLFETKEEFTERVSERVI